MSYPEGINWRTLASMAIIYVIPATLSAESKAEFNYGLAGLGAISYILVEGAYLIREAQRSYALPRDDDGYRADYDFVGHGMKAVSGILLFGLAFGKVEAARRVVDVGMTLGRHMKLVLSERS